MERIAFADGRPQVQADFLAQALDLSTDALRRGMRDGAITSRYEAGEEEHAGRIRLTFFAPGRRLQIVAEESGRILTCVTAPLPRPPSRAETQASETKTGRSRRP